MKKRTISFIIVVCVLITGTLPAFAAPYVTSKGACVMDFDTGEILYELNSNASRVPASMTKIMTAYCIYDAISNGEISLDTQVPISADVSLLSRDSEFQNVPLYTNQIYTVDEMLDIIVVYSACVATIAVAELISGSEWNFVNRMNQKAASLGIEASFVDTNGMSNSNLITPNGMAVLARNIIKDYPDIINRSSKKSVYFHGKKYDTTNYLLDKYFYEGADGLKTGTLNIAGNCLCATAVRDDKRIISVTMGSTTNNQRFVDTINLLNYGFSVANYSKTNLYFTDISTYINGMEIPTFIYQAEPSYAVVVAEDLASYGFDLNFVDEEKTLYISYNGNIPVSPKIMDYYKNKNGQRACKIVLDNTVKVFLTDANCELQNVYNTGNYMCIAVDDLAKAYGYTWDSAGRRADITADISQKQQ